MRVRLAALRAQTLGQHQLTYVSAGAGPASHADGRVSLLCSAAASTDERPRLAQRTRTGICVAFRAPLAGCMFVVEEAGSHFTTQHLEYTFFACVIAYLLALIIADPDEGFVKFKQVGSAQLARSRWPCARAPVWRAAHCYLLSPLQRAAASELPHRH
jgi:hypothetical protein